MVITRYTIKKIAPTITPIMISTAPTALLLPDPKYAVKIPATIVPSAKMSKNILSMK
jgi:hypothetical protein